MKLYHEGIVGRFGGSICISEEACYLDNLETTVGEILHRNMMDLLEKEYPDLEIDIPRFDDWIDYIPLVVTNKTICRIELEFIDTRAPIFNPSLLVNGGLNNLV